MKARWIRPADEVRGDYNFLMRYRTGERKKWYRGVEGVEYVFNGEWADPEIVYGGYAINEPTATDGLWGMYRDETGQDSQDGFSAWLRENRELFLSSLDALIEELPGNKGTA